MINILVNVGIVVLVGIVVIGKDFAGSHGMELGPPCSRRLSIFIMKG